VLLEVSSDVGNCARDELEVKIVEIESLLMSVEECVDNVVSDAIVENVDELIDSIDDLSKFDVIMFEL
jgi:hypothetical protein